MMTSGFDIDELERLLAAATPGEWASGIRDGYRAVAGGAGEWIAIFPNGHRHGFGCTNDDEIQANKSLIVTARNSLPAILTEIRELRAENARLRGALEWALAEIDGRTRYRDTKIYTAQDQRDNALELARAALGEPQ